MKKYVNLSLVCAILGLLCGVFYREFTKIFAFTAKTMLAAAHSHLLLLGSVAFLLVGMLAAKYPLESEKTFRVAGILYPAGLALTVLLMLLRGIFQVADVALSRGLDASVSGIAGIGHILLGVGILFFFVALKKAVREEGGK